MQVGWLRLRSGFWAGAPVTGWRCLGKPHWEGDKCPVIQLENKARERQADTFQSIGLKRFPFSRAWVRLPLRVPAGLHTWLFWLLPLHPFGEGGASALGLWGWTDTRLTPDRGDQHSSSIKCAHSSWKEDLACHTGS